MGLNILLAEGNDYDAFLIRQAVTRSSSLINLACVTDGLSVMRYLDAKPPYETREFPSLILLEVNLPLLSGMDVLHWIRSQRCYRHIPVALLVDSMKQLGDLTVPETGADIVFVKPGTASEWFSTMMYFAEHPKSPHANLTGSESSPEAAVVLAM